MVLSDNNVSQSNLYIESLKEHRNNVIIRIKTVPYIFNEKLSEAKYMFNYIMLFKNKFHLNDLSRKRIVEIYLQNRTLAVIKTRSQILKNVDKATAQDRKRRARH